MNPLALLIMTQGGSGEEEPTDPVIPTDEVIIGQVDQDGADIPDRVDALSFSPLNDGTLFGSFNYWEGSGGSDEGECHQKVVTSEDGTSFVDGPLVAKYENADLNAAYHHRSNGELACVFLSLITEGSQLNKVVYKKAPAPGGTFADFAEIAGQDGTQRWILSPGERFITYKGKLLLAAARAGLGSEMESRRDAFVLVSDDDGGSFTVAESSPGVLFMISNDNGGGLYATESVLWIDIFDALWIAFRTKDGFLRGCKIDIDDDGYFVKLNAVRDILPAPGSTSHIRKRSGANRWYAAHNDPDDDESGGNFDGTARKNMLLSVSTTGLPNSFTPLANKIKSWNADDIYCMEPHITDMEHGILVSWTEYTFSGAFFVQKTRYLTDAMLLSSDPWD